MFNFLSTKRNISLKYVLFSLLSSSILMPVMAGDEYWYGFAWGGMSGACVAYQNDQMSYKDAKSMVRFFLEIGEENINSRNLYSKLKNLQYGDTFRDGCESLTSY